MSGRVLLDSNIIIGLFAEDAAVKQGVIEADEVFIPIIVIGELYYGARNSGQSEINVMRIDTFVSHNVILDCDSRTASHYRIVKHGLKGKGRPIPENDIWIAAIAIQHGLRLISRDEHFFYVDKLSWEKW